MYISSTHHSPPHSPQKRIISSALLLMIMMLLIVSQSFASRSYGPTKANDYLGKIVDKSYPQSQLKKSQIMVAILRANPQAFKGGNIHFLRRAVTLILPDEEVIATIPPQEAAALIAEHLTYFKRGETGNFINSPLPTPVVEKATVTNLPETETTADTRDNTEPAISPKVSIEIRKEAQEKDNKEKQLQSLEKLNAQQNKTLTTLDQQIRILENQLKSDARKAKQNSPDNSTATADDLRTSTEKSRDNKVASESLGSESHSHIKKEATDTNDTTQSPPRTRQQPTSEPSATETSDDMTATAENAIAALTAKLSESSRESTANIPDRDSTPPATTEAKVPGETPSSQAASPVSASSPASASASGRSSSLFDRINNPLIILLGLLALTLILLGYFFSNRSQKQQTSIATTSTLSTDRPVATAITPAVNTDQERLLNPVIKTRDIINKDRDRGNTPVATTTTAANDNDYQEAEIKINMARAYLDLGYIDASREVLEEVLDEGTEEQKDTVRQMLSML